jgi:hypothetical protein
VWVLRLEQTAAPEALGRRQSRPIEQHRADMWEITNWTEGSVRLSKDTVVHRGGTIEHDLTVPANTRLDLHGGVGGDLIVEPGGIAVVRGTVLGTLFNEGGEVEVCRGAAVDTVSDATGIQTRIAPGALVAR